MRKLDAVLPMPKYVYAVECPVMKYHEETRSSRDVLCSAAWEEIVDDVESPPGMSVAIATSSWHPCSE